MQAFAQQASADEIVLQYERQLVAGDTKTAGNIKASHKDLSSRFEAVDERLARK